MRKRFVFKKNHHLFPVGEKMVEVDPDAKLQIRPRVHIISDLQQPVRCMADGKMYDSRRHYQDAVKAHGCRIVGNDWNDAPMKREVKRDKKSVKRDIAKTIAQLNA